MLLLLPLGPVQDDRRAPRVTVALIALNVLVLLLTLGFESDRAVAREGEIERVAEWTLRQARARVPALASRAQGPALAFFERDGLWRHELAGSPELRDRAEACLEDVGAVRASSPFHRFGFVPAEVTLIRLLAHQFLHGGLLHLGFNMLFLWTVGGLIERTLGAVAFGSAYLAGGMAAAVAHAATHPGSTEPVIGASGAVAAAMGLFTVLHGRERMNLAVVAAPLLVPRVYFVAWPAWVFLGLWLLDQVFFASFGAVTLGIAFAAHLGGFAFGALLGVAWRLYASRA